MEIIKVFEFDAAHYVPSYNGKCENMHGHTYKLQVTVDGVPDNEGMVIDFALLKQIVQDKIINVFDHHLLNDIIPVPTAENIAVFVWNAIEPLVKTDRYHLTEVQVWETSHNGCVYRGK